MVGTVEIDDGAEVVQAEMTTPGPTELVELFCRMRDHGVTHCVMEVSSHALHQHRVAGIEWAVGIFTNLTGGSPGLSQDDGCVRRGQGAAV